MDLARQRRLDHGSDEVESIVRQQCHRFIDGRLGRRVTRRTLDGQRPIAAWPLSLEVVFLFVTQNRTGFSSLSAPAFRERVRALGAKRTTQRW